MDSKIPMLSFEAKADISDLLTLATLLVTIYLAYQTSREFSKKERQNLCLSLLERWNSEALVHKRSKAWSYLHSISSPDSKETIFLGDISYSNELEKREIYDAIIQVTHFFSDFRSLWERDLLDDKLATTLFSHSIKVWFQFLRRIDSRRNEQDTNIRFLNANTWRVNNVLPLERIYQKRFKRVYR